MKDIKAHSDSINSRRDLWRFKPGKFVPSPEEWAKTNRQWLCMVWLCVVLLASTAAFGVLMLDFRSQLHEQRIELDQTTDKALELWRRSERQRQWMLKHMPNRDWPGKGE